MPPSICCSMYDASALLSLGGCRPLCRTVTAAGAAAGTGAEAAAGAGAPHNGSRAASQQGPLVPRAHHHAAMQTLAANQQRPLDPRAHCHAAMQTLPLAAGSSSCSVHPALIGRTRALGIVAGVVMIGVLTEAGLGTVTGVLSRITGQSMAGAAAGTKMTIEATEAVTGGMTGRVTGVGVGAVTGSRGTGMTGTGLGKAGVTGVAADMAAGAEAEAGAVIDGGSCGLQVWPGCIQHHLVSATALQVVVLVCLHC